MKEQKRREKERNEQEKKEGRAKENTPRVNTDKRWHGEIPTTIFFLDCPFHFFKLFLPCHNRILGSERGREKIERNERGKIEKEMREKIEKEMKENSYGLIQKFEPAAF